VIECKLISGALQRDGLRKYHTFAFLTIMKESYKKKKISAIRSKVKSVAVFN